MKENNTQPAIGELKQYRNNITKALDDCRLSGTGQYNNRRKYVTAVPATRKEYCDWRGWDVPVNEDGSDEGFVYVDLTKPTNMRNEGVGGFVTWLPKGIFTRDFVSLNDTSPALDVSEQPVASVRGKILAAGKTTITVVLDENEPKPTEALEAYLKAFNSELQERRALVSQDKDNDLPAVAQVKDQIRNFYKLQGGMLLECTYSKHIERVGTIVNNHPGSSRDDFDFSQYGLDTIGYSFVDQEDPLNSVFLGIGDIPEALLRPFDPEVVEAADALKVSALGLQDFVNLERKMALDQANGNLEDFTTAMNFGSALAGLENGAAIARAGWNGKGMFVYLVPAGAYPARTDAAKNYFGAEALVPYNPYMAIKNVDGTVSTWVPSVNDVLAKDWVFVHYGPRTA